MASTIHQKFVALCLLACSLPLAVNEVHASAMIPMSVGEASDLENGTLLYTETHCVRDDSLLREVIYKDTGQQLIAKKVLSYSSGFLTPSYIQKNFYSGESVAVKLRQDELEMTMDTADSPVSQTTVISVSNRAMPLVIDAGFDTFVTQHWNSLVAGQSRQFQFPFAARESLVELRISATSCSYEGDNDQCFELELNNWLLSKIVSPIELGYDPVSKRLSRFRGLSNIGDGSGGGQSVDIRYTYQDVPATACVASDDEVAAAGLDSGTLSLL